MKEKYREIRKEIFLTGYSVNIAHLASAFSIVEIVDVLYNDIMNITKETYKDEDRDIFILSKGHGSLALYVTLYNKGIITREELDKFCKPNSLLGGEPCYPYASGIEFATGSLGHGLSLGVGVALAKKLDNKKEKTYVLLGDGECEEGTIWEACMFANKYELNNLVAIVDCNKIQKMGSLEEVMNINSWAKTFKSFGWRVIEVDGHNPEELKIALTKKNNSKKPTVILASTIKGYGVALMENNPKWHWRLPNKKEVKIFASELNISEEELKKCKNRI